MTGSDARSRSRPSRGSVVVCGDYGDDRCGVGDSEAALFRGIGMTPTVVDPCAQFKSLRATIRTARLEKRGAVIVYPTRSTVRNLRVLLVLAAATFALRRNGVRWHLHEYKRFREIRWAINVCIALGARRIVVSTASEADALRRAWHGRLCRRRVIVVAPAANGSARVGAIGAPEPDNGVVGVFGRYRPDDKDAGWLNDVLANLPSRFTQLELIGSGWDDAMWPPMVTERYEITALGRVAAEDLGKRFARWALAVASFAEGASDSRTSLRTPLAYGVPTITRVHEPADLTVRPPHLVIADAAGRIPDADLATAMEADRHTAADEVARFESECRDRLAEALQLKPA